MTAPRMRFVGGRQFMWDGRTYISHEEADAAQATYQRDGFETSTCQQDGAFLVYTRRPVRPGAAG